MKKRNANDYQSILVRAEIKPFLVPIGLPRDPVIPEDSRSHIFSSHSQRNNSLFLSSLESSDTKVYEPKIRALLGGHIFQPSKPRTPNPEPAIQSTNSKPRTSHPIPELQTLNPDNGHPPPATFKIAYLTRDTFPNWNQAPGPRH